METINIGIADDHKVFREGIISLFSQVEDMDIVLEASGGQDLLERLAPLPRLPHIILLDIEMPGTNGFKVQEVIHHQYPDIKTISFSAYDNEHSALNMFRRGTMGFLSKGSSFKEMKKAIRQVQAGFYYFDNPNYRNLIHRIQQGYKYPKITARELEFLHYCCTELTYKEIAVRMGIGRRTVEGYRQSLCEKLDTVSRAGLVIFALSTGIVTRKFNP